MDGTRYESKENTNPKRLMKSISKYSDDDVFSIDVGTSTVWSTRYLNLSVNNKFIISSWLGTMGCGLREQLLLKSLSLNVKLSQCLVTVHSNGNARLCCCSI